MFYIRQVHPACSHMLVSVFMWSYCFDSEICEHNARIHHKTFRPFTTAPSLQKCLGGGPMMLMEDLKFHNLHPWHLLQKFGVKWQLTKRHDRCISAMPVLNGDVTCDKWNYVWNDVILCTVSQQHQTDTSCLAWIPLIFVIILVLQSRWWRYHEMSFDGLSVHEQPWHSFGSCPNLANIVVQEC